MSNGHHMLNYDSGNILCKLHSDVIDVITQKSRLKYQIRYDM